MECSYQCGAQFPHRLMDEHQRDECPLRPMDVKLESFMKRMETKLMTERERHEREMKKMEDKYRSEIVAMKSESDKRHELELAKHRKETEIKMAELKVTISVTHTML